MRSDEIMPELLRQQNPSSLGWREGGLSCWESSSEITPPLQRDALSRAAGRVPKAG